MTQTSTDLAIRRASDAQDYMPVLSIEQAVDRYNAIVEFTKKLLKPNRDYGTIPGTGKKNDDGTPSNSSDTLLKPGAEKLCTLFGLSVRFEDYRSTEDWDKGLFYYAYRCIVKNRSDRDIAESIGSANSFEKKYRTSTRSCPECGSEAIKRSKFPPRDKPNAQPGWYCNAKTGGCGANFDGDDQEIVAQSDKIDVLAAADKVNTLQKMAQKRAYVGAVLLATNASEFFTQDVEDLDPVRQEEIIEADIANSADDDRDFLAKWDSISDSHQLHQKIGRDSVLGVMFKRRNLKDLPAASFEVRKEMIADFEAFTPEQIQKLKDAVTKKNSQPVTDNVKLADEPAITDALVQTWGDFVAAAIESATRHGVSDDQCLAGLNRLCGNRTGDDVTKTERRVALKAIREGTFDYDKGTIGTKKNGKAA